MLAPRRRPSRSRALAPADLAPAERGTPTLPTLAALEGRDAATQARADLDARGERSILPTSTATPRRSERSCSRPTLLGVARAAPATVRYVPRDGTGSGCAEPAASSPELQKPSHGDGLRRASPARRARWTSSACGRRGGQDTRDLRRRVLRSCRCSSPWATRRSPFTAAAVPAGATAIEIRAWLARAARCRGGRRRRSTRRSATPTRSRDGRDFPEVPRQPWTQGSWAGQPGSSGSRAAGRRPARRYPVEGSPSSP